MLVSGLLGRVVLLGLIFDVVELLFCCAYVLWLIGTLLVDLA